MINCQIVIGSTRKHAADSFTNQTTRFACVPNLTMAYLAFSLAKSTEVKVVVDDIDIHKEVLPKGNHERSLASILSEAPIAPTGENGIWTKQNAIHPTRPSTAEAPQPHVFKAVFRDSDGSQRVVATFEFALLDSDSYVQQLERYDASHTPKAPTLEDCGGKDVSTCCWHCQSYVPKHRSTCPNCGMSRDFPSQAKKGFVNY